PESYMKAPAGSTTIYADGGCVLPGLNDSHTHAVCAGTRENEFVQRIAGKSYLDIAHAGGGIRVTVDAVRAASRAELVELALPRLRRMLHNGVTTVEIKSGYGLAVADEIKTLEVIRELKALQPIELVPTYLAAHTVPREFAGRAEEYLDTILDDGVLGRIRDEKFAEFCDVFCETTAFDMMQSHRVLEAGKRFGLRPKVHADQLTQMGAGVLAARVGAISADHLEKIDAAGIAAMKDAGCIAVLLPGCSFFLGAEQAPARTMLDADLPVALATDFNPGSSMVESLPLVMSIACVQMRMSPTEAVVAATANAAAAVDRHRRVGAIAVGMQADLVILEVPNHERWLYEPGRNCVATVLKRGKVVASRG
ncbi:MAG: imidazolonepropionase, partial [Phycisphaerales bacterium]|nr:imidazolonepropionase [Phycisphaerales bacterium]